MVAEEAQSDNLEVLFWARQDLHERPGGDTIQMLNAAKALRDAGVEVTICSDPHVELSAFHCVHLWHLERPHETCIYCKRAAAHGKPIALSPIYWPGSARLPSARDGQFPLRRRMSENAKNALRWLLAESEFERQATLLALRRGWARCRKEILDSAAIILPNSCAEAQVISEQADVADRVLVVPNSIDLSECDACLSQESAPARTGVLCVGHFDPRKNQFLLIRALRDTDISVTFAGAARRMHRRYYRRCVRSGKGRYTFVGPQPHAAALRHMRRARVHVCPSNFETPGLANLEAAVMGCSLVVPECPPVREYFQDGACYFLPGDAGSLRRAVLKALSQEPCQSLAQRIREDFNLAALARKMIDAYRRVIA